MKTEIKPLYRKVNTNTHYVHHNSGSDARHDRNTKGGLKRSMKKGVERGLDYTPLYKYLLSRIGDKWDNIYRDILPRVVDRDPIFHLINNDGKFKQGYIRCGESSYYSALIIDDNGILQLEKPDLKNEDIYPSCSCCTHTFNGKVLNNKYSNNPAFYV